MAFPTDNGYFEIPYHILAGDGERDSALTFSFTTLVT